MNEHNSKCFSCLPAYELDLMARVQRNPIALRFSYLDGAIRSTSMKIKRRQDISLHCDLTDLVSSRTAGAGWAMTIGCSTSRGENRCALNECGHIV